MTDVERPCAYCNDGIAVPRLCPRTIDTRTGALGELCGWCCPVCSRRCARGVLVDLRPAAARVAETLMLEPDDTLDAALVRWEAAYRSSAPGEVEPAMREAAANVLRQRLDGVLPPPASASGLFRREGPLLRGDD